jgi:hypothetical protein
MSIINGRGTVGIRRGTVIGPPTDPDAAAFIIAANITGATQASAITTLVLSLKSYGIWTKMKAIYPFVGGTPSSHKFNLKDPRDADNAYRLLFTAGLTHSQNGINGNGIGYANTNLNPNSKFYTPSICLSYYSRSNTSLVDTRDMGCADSPSGNYCSLLIKRSSDSLSISIISKPNFVGSAALYTLANTQGFFKANRLNSTNNKFYKNGISLATDSTNVSDYIYPSYNILITASNLGGTVTYSNRECAFASISDGLTDTESSNFYTAVQTYQTTLGRQV